MDSLPPDPYKALGLPKDAELPAIRSAHRKLVLKCHPDKVQDPELKAIKQDEFQSVQQAYELLSDDKRRVAYDEKVKLLELRREMGRGNPTARSNPFEYEVRNAEPRTTSTYSRPPAPNVYTQPAPRSYEDVSYDEQTRSASRKTANYESTDRKRNSTREEERERERRRHEEDERLRQKAERKAEKSGHGDKKKTRDKERRRGTEEKTRTRTTTQMEDDSEEEYQRAAPRGFEKKTSKHRMEEEMRMRDDAIRAERIAQAEQIARAEHAQRIARERERDARPVSKPTVPLDPKFASHMDFAGQYMQAAKLKVKEHSDHPPPMRRAETFAAPQPSYDIRYVVHPQQTSDDEAPRRSRAGKETRRTSDTPVARPVSSSREKANKGSRRSPPQDPYIVEPPSPSLKAKMPSLQTHSSAPPNLSNMRKEPTRSKTTDYPRTEKMPAVTRSATFSAVGDRGDHGREQRGSRLKQQVDYTSESDSDTPQYQPQRHSRSPPRRVVQEPTRYIIDNGRTIPLKRSEGRPEERSKSPTRRPPITRQGSERPRAAPTRSQSQSYYPPENPHAEPIILTARPKMSPRETSHRSSPRNSGGGGGQYYGDVPKYTMPQYDRADVIYATQSHGEWSGRRSGDSRGGGGEYGYPSTSGRGRETAYT